MASNAPEQDGHCELAVPSNPLITHRCGPYRRGISPRRNMRRERQPGPRVRLARLVEEALQVRGSGGGGGWNKKGFAVFTVMAQAAGPGSGFDVDEPAAARQWQLQLCRALGLTGRIHVAGEGINGTVSGTREGIDGLLAYLNADERINPISFKE